ncbi:MAG: apolipoprotein N-acyltransferase [Rhizobiaceae bacterium]|jgi:apolipoprotein N-acyltransferase|nr:apolipoprotein N-acyltransferase [Rhizobiaceae bacterium]
MEKLAGTITLLTGWRRALVAFLAGAVLALALAPVDVFAAGFLAFPVLVWLLDGAVPSPSAGFLSARLPAFRTGWMFGFGYFLAGFWWIGAAILVDAANFAWALPLAVLGLPAVLAVFFGLACGLAHFGWHDGPARIFALAAAFTGVEMVRAVVLTGFPWNALGYTLANNPVFLQTAALIGVDGMAATAVLAFAAPALLTGRHGRSLGLALPVLVIGAMAAWGLARPSVQPLATDAQTLTVRLVQPSIDQSQKWDDAAKDAIFATLMRLTADAAPMAGPAGDAAPSRPDVVIWPETALPFLLEERPQALAMIGEALEDGQTLLTGAVRVEGGTGTEVRFYNALLAIDDEGAVTGAADKLHLVPFGEYLPLREWLEPLGLREIAVTPGVFSAGVNATPITLAGGTMIMPLICYEAIFPAAVRQAAQKADLLVNVTNDAWYGATPGPYQHFRQAQLRAVENGLPLLRVGNNGLSAVVDPYGRVAGGLALNAVAHSDVQVRLQRITTPYSQFGQWMPLGLVVLTMLLHSVLAWITHRAMRRY